MPDAQTPRSAPIFIPATCPRRDCGAALVLDDVLDELPRELHFFDEWACPNHRETVHFDVPGATGAAA